MAADGDGDGSVFEMGFNNGNDAAIANDVRHGRGGERDNQSLKNRVGHTSLGSSQAGGERRGGDARAAAGCR